MRVKKIIALILSVSLALEVMPVAAEEESLDYDPLQYEFGTESLPAAEDVLYVNIERIV